MTRDRICISRAQQRGILALLALGLIGLVVAQAPDAKRYIKFETM